MRCALSKAIDRQELIDLTAGGILQVANGLFSPGQEGYLEDNGFDTAQDLEGAQALIDEYLAENPGPVDGHLRHDGRRRSTARPPSCSRATGPQIGVDTEHRPDPAGPVHHQGAVR